MSKNMQGDQGMQGQVAEVRRSQREIDEGSPRVRSETLKRARTSGNVTPRRRREPEVDCALRHPHRSKGYYKAAIL